MPRSTVPAFLRDPVQRATLAAELHTKADDLDLPDDDGRGPDRLTQVRADRLRTWAGELDDYGVDHG